MRTPRVLVAAISSVILVVVLLVLWRLPSNDAVIVYTSVDQIFSEPILRRFESETGIAVRAVFDTEETKSTGVLNRLIAEAKSPQATVFWSGDPVRPFLLIGRGIVDPYASTSARTIPQEFKSAEGTWTGFAARARVLLVNRQKLADRSMPRSVRDLADPQWKGMAAIANPLFGTTTMHVAAWFSAWGDDEAKRFMTALRENDVRIASSNGEVKRLVVAGEVVFGLTDTDDANEALKEGAAVEVVYPDQEGMGTLIMPTTVVLIRGGPQADLGRRFVDFLLSPEIERLMAESAAHMPLHPDVPTPVQVRRVGDIRAMRVDYARISLEMERIHPWLRQWAGL